jgi:hypothetical protein
LSLEPIRKAYRFKTLSNDYVYISDPSDEEFHSKVSLNRWGNECFLKLLFDDSKIPKGQKDVKLEDNKVKWSSSDFDFHFYPSEVGELGGLEIEIILKKKPSANVFAFGIQSQGLKFYYQPSLTQEEIDAGAVRPENVVGSYAVYHATRTNMHRSQADAEKYRAGKAFHIYRPKAVDSAGNMTWCDLNIDEAKGLLTVTVPQEFLDNAVYPVSIDPTFGYTSVGGSYETKSGDYIVGSLFTSPSDVSTATSITFYVQDIWGLDIYGKGVIVKHSDLKIITNGVGNPSTRFPYYDENPDWRTSIFATPPSLSPNTEYILMVITNDLFNFWYDTGSTNQGHEEPNSYASPYDLSDPLHTDYKWSIYCTYTAGGGGQQVSKTVIEYLAGYDVKGRVASLYRSKIDYIGLLDTKVRLSNVFRVFAEQLGLFDTKMKGLLKNINEQLGTLDKKIKILSKVMKDYIGLSDIKSRVASLYRMFSEYVDLTDKKLKILSKNFTEYIGIADIKSRIINKYRMITEYLGLLDVKLKTLSKIITENVGLKDVKSKISSLYRTFNEHIGLLDTKVKTLSKTFSEVLGLIDSVIHQAIFVIYRTVVEYMGLLESKCKTLSKVTTEKIALLDVKSRIASLHRIFIENLGMIDNKIKSLNKTIMQYIGILDNKVKSLSKTITENIKLLDLKLKTLSKNVVQYLGLDGFRYIGGQIVSRIVTEIITFSDNILKELPIRWRKIRGYFIEDYERLKKKRLLRLLRQYIIGEESEKE